MSRKTITKLVWEWSLMDFNCLMERLELDGYTPCLETFRVLEIDGRARYMVMMQKLGEEQEYADGEGEE